MTPSRTAETAEALRATGPLQHTAVQVCRSDLGQALRQRSHEIGRAGQVDLSPRQPIGRVPLCRLQHLQRLQYRVGSLAPGAGSGKTAEKPSSASAQARTWRAR